MKWKTVAVGLLTAGSCFASDVSFWFGIGQNKDLSMEIGYSYKNYGANIYNAGNYDYAEGEVINSRPPHTSYVVEKGRKVGGTIGMDVMYFVNLWKFRPFVEGGFTVEEKRDIAVSTNILDKGALYTLNRKTKLGFAGGAGLQFRYKLLLIGVEFHTAKGIIGQVGFAFWWTR